MRSLHQLSNIPIRLLLCLGLATRTSGVIDHELIGWGGESYIAPPRSPSDLQTVEMPAHAYDLSKIQVISLKDPHAFLVKGFLSDEECEHLISISRKKLHRSGVVDVETGNALESEARTSSGAFFNRGSDNVVATIERRIADYTHIPVERGEGIQVLNYDIGQQYREHYDFFFHDAADDNGGNRLATALLYMNTPEEGGETVFPMSKHKAPGYVPGSMSECGSNGLGIKPEKGDMLVFWSIGSNGELDMYSKHSGCPVIRGEKWTATKWMHVGHFADYGFGSEKVLTTKYTPPAPPITDTCFDENAKFCPGWATSGECDINPPYMHAACRWSCRVC